jgi:hypothetical protein
MKVITSFQGRYRFLSNFYPVRICVHDLVFPSVEHAYQAQKTDKINWHLFTSENLSAGRAKRLGNQLRVRKDWDDVKLGIMRELLSMKFSHLSLAYKLRATGSAELIEGNTWGDVYWGVCNGEGQNHLGKLLMDIRKNLNRSWEGPT